MVVGGLYSGEGEYLSFPTRVPVKESVDVWMSKVDASMRAIVQMRIQQVSTHCY